MKNRRDGRQKNQREIVELRNAVVAIKRSVEGLSSGMEKTEERSGKLETDQ